MLYVVVALVLLYIIYGCFMDDGQTKCVIKQQKAGNIRNDGVCSKRSHGPRCYGCICNRDTIDE